VVHGRVEGQISVQRKIDMCSTADVQADVATPNLIVHEGALYNGRTSMKRAAVVGEAGTRGGNQAKDNKARQPDAPNIDPVADHTTGIAARTPDISFA
jgi:cytoskeletal protein CcmA (bactofilin family)